MKIQSCLKPKGYYLVEILVAIAMLAMLAATLLPMIHYHNKKKALEKEFPHSLVIKKY